MYSDKVRMSYIQSVRSDLEYSQVIRDFKHREPQWYKLQIWISNRSNTSYLFFIS